MKQNKRGFTLMEVLVVVVIIGILGAIMLPQYQRAVLKSRFAALMPIAKSMADSNEAYYLEHGEYADNAEDLPIQGRRNYSDGTELEFGTLTGYSYVLATRNNDFPNNYIVYQKHSKNFADNTHCEALTADDNANQVCLSFGGTPLDGSLGGDDYTAYLLSGNGNGTFEKECKGPFTTEKECPSGCGVMTRDSAGCNTATGQWTEEGFDEEDCPKPLGTETEDCPAGYLPGTHSREGNVCKNDNSGYTYGVWSDTCQPDPCYGASTCENNVPTACQSKFYFQNGKCKACPIGSTGCYLSGSFLRMNGCEEGYYPTTNTMNGPIVSCTSCSHTYGSAAITCTNLTPTACIEGYYVYDHACRSCGNFGAALTCNSSTGAKTCKSGYHLTRPYSNDRHYYCRPD